MPNRNPPLQGYLKMSLRRERTKYLDEEKKKKLSKSLIRKCALVL